MGVKAKPVQVGTFYRFVAIDDVEQAVALWRDACEQEGLRGTVLLAAEGVNATLVGDRDRIDRCLATVAVDPRFRGLVPRYSGAANDNPVFHRLKVRAKPEIVTMGVAGVTPAVATGEHVDAERWHQLLDDPDVLVIDTRNDYEVAIGTFEGATHPATTNFREFPDYVAEHLDPAEHPRVAMCCTGGIRCEKASAYLLGLGFEAVYQLDGGILSYLEQVTPETNRWRGECFVFDQRVSVDAALDEGGYEQCFACRHPLSAEDLASPDYRLGVSCPRCVDAVEPARRGGFAERRRQVELADTRGTRHIGPAEPTARSAD